ncbi:MAG: FG-GAP repeat protein [candidate division BRC1 bacterium ADurb.Bin183]|nr:MAG: FG-GAP repeat protein [candidate division BRC1 bacterium ADurb.Bin183]
MKKSLFMWVILYCILLFSHNVHGLEVKDFSQTQPDYAIKDNARNPGKISAIALGDVNGDGYEDIILGAPRAAAMGRADTGIVYIRFGLNFGNGPSQLHESSFDLTTTSTQFSDPTVSSINLDDGHGRLGGAQFNGEVPNGRFGTAVAVGDFDGDGIDDIAISMSEELPTIGSGRVYLIKGRTDLAGTISLLNERLEHRSFYINGRANGDRFGATLFFADLDNDGKDDLIIGTPDSGSGGIVDIFYGRDFIPFFSQGADSLPQPHTVIIFEGANDSLGAAFAAGDLTGDGIADLCISAPNHSLYASHAGKVYVFAGANRDFSQCKPLPAGTVDLSVTTGTVVIYSQTIAEQAGHSIAIGDYNNDGMKDLVIGAPGWTNIDEPDMGRIYILHNDGNMFINTGRKMLNLSHIECTKIYSQLPYHRFGSRISFLNFDLHNGEDFVVSAPPAWYNSFMLSGMAWIFIGRTPTARLGNGQFPMSYDSILMICCGEAVGDMMGSQMAAGDFNGDGADDIFFTGAQGVNPAGRSVWGIFGSSSYHVSPVSNGMWVHYR